MDSKLLIKHIPPVLLKAIPDKVFLVGGCVRDFIMNKTPEDYDIVVDMTELDFRSKFPEYKTVGNSFPVFLIDGCEVTLTRTESKSGAGYKGFEVSSTGVGIITDLKRRDLRMNAIAMDSHGRIIDPFQGVNDIQNKVLKHVSTAFSEDPVRVLRVARFHARYGFNIHPETLKLMSDVVHELSAVEPDRIWAEIRKSLTEKKCLKMFQALQACGALEIDVLKIYKGFNAKQLHLADIANSEVARFVSIALNFKTDKDYLRHRIPNEFSKFSKLYNSHNDSVKEYHSLNIVERLNLMISLRAMNDPSTAESLFRYANIISGSLNNNLDKLKSDLVRVNRVDASLISSQHKDGKEINRAIFEARLKELQR